MVERAGSRIVPGMRYRDPVAAIEWLCRCLGFERKLVVEGEGGAIEHAQLVLGPCMIMLGGHRDDAYGRLMRTPREVGGNTQAAYLVVPDVDAHYQRARAAGAEIVFDIEGKPYGGRGYTCRDPEGHLWNFGDHDPWR